MAKRVLVVDDEADVRDALARAIRIAGYSVEKAQTAKEALALCSRSEERRVGKECMPVCRSRWSPYH